MAQCAVCGQNVESGEDIAVENFQYAVSALAEFRMYFGIAIGHLESVQSEEGVGAVNDFLDHIHDLLEEVAIATEETFPDPEAEEE